MTYPENNLDNKEYDDDPIKELKPSKGVKIITITLVIIIFIIGVSLVSIKMLVDYMNNWETGIQINDKEIYYNNDEEIYYNDLKQYKSANELTIGKYYFLKVMPEEKYQYSMYLSANSEDGMYASFIYYFPDQTRIIFSLPPDLLIKEDYLTDFYVQGRLYKEQYGVKNLKIDVSKKDVLYANNAVWRADEYINIDTVKSVDELVEGQKYYLEEEKLTDEIEWGIWPHYIIHKLKDGTEIWFIIEEEKQQFNKNNVRKEGMLSIERRVKDPNNEDFTVYIVR